LTLASKKLNGPLGIPKSKKRDSLEIISEMLSAAANGSRKTGIMYKANLSYELLVEYLSVIREARFIETPDEKTFFLTSRGRRFLKEFKEYKELRESANQKALEIRRFLAQ
jgi:predicted transcriptional regulator